MIVNEGSTHFKMYQIFKGNCVVEVNIPGGEARKPVNHLKQNGMQNPNRGLQPFELVTPEH